MFFTQFFGAFNDNVFKQALILVLTYSAAVKLGMEVSLLNNLAAMLFILPYFLFSALAGQIADKYEKSLLTRRIKLLEIIIMAVAAIGFIFEIYSLLFICLFMMGAQSTFLAPSNTPICLRPCTAMNWWQPMAYFRPVPVLPS